MSSSGGFIGGHKGLKVKRIKYHSQGSEKGDTLPVF